jgi:hypothetical protein
MLDRDEGPAETPEIKPVQRLGPARVVAGLVIVFVGAMVAAVAVPLLQGTGQSSPTALPPGSAPPPSAPQPSASTGELRFGIVCTMSTDDNYCPRLTDTILRRTSLTPAQYAAAEKVSEQVMDALPPGVEQEPICDPMPGSTPQDGGTLDEVCSVDVLPPPVPTVRRALAAVGHPDAIVRVARAGDPAPIGRLLVVVPDGPACVLVIDQGTDRNSTVGGRLPNGRCL